ncbi:MAG: hypothetical protein AAF559_03835 [Pseudomonadota bacterium]
MVIEKLRQKVREQAELEQAERGAKARRRRARRPSLPKPVKGAFSPAIAAHPIFLPALGIWGAALAGLSVLMLSRVMIARISVIAGLGALGSGAAYIYAAVAAVIGAGVALVVGLALQRAARRARRASRSRSGHAKGGRASSEPSIAESVTRHLGPIDPAAELGSESLDAPIGEMPFSCASEDAATEELANKDEGSPQDNDLPAELPNTETSDDSPLELEDALDLPHDAETATDPTIAPDGSAPDDDEPDALDLGAFDALDQSDPVAQEAVVEDDPAPAPHAEPEPQPAPKRPITGIEKLRQSSPENLSLVQLVERFAAALHDIQDRAPGAVAAGTIPSGNTERERALAEALKALALFSDRGFAQSGSETGAQTSTITKPKGLPGSLGAAFGGQANSAAAISDTEQQLRDALAKLQNLRGAA